jgi:hypothetical protein
MNRAPLFVANPYRSEANNEAILLCRGDFEGVYDHGYSVRFAGNDRGLYGRRRPQ